MAEAEKSEYTPNEPELLTVEDLSYLVYMEMENVLDTLEHRWAKMKPKQMYTSLSTILIAINPYERIHSVYTEDVIQDFFKQAERGAVTFRPPHPYGVGARSYTRMIARNSPQSVIICGESGAGKTETAKLVIRYLAQTTPGKGESSGTIEMQIMNASPILEAFGNAKTVLNNNSSRFGKFTKVLYTMDGNDDVPSGSIVGATLETYLLEKSRVIFQANKERNYHSFYFTVAGLSDEQKAEYGVQDLMKFFYTNQGGATEVPGIPDLERYEELKCSLSLYRIGEANQQELWQSVLAILHLGNVSFKKDDQDFAVVDPKCKEHLDMSARLFGIETEALQKRLETASLKVGKKKITKKIQFAQGTNNRDAITKGFYEKIFLYLAKRINDDLSQVDDSSGTAFQFIGILDVFGFENFKVNSLEQFCINFTNEKLQNYFNKNIIESEQEEYLRESVVWTEIDVPNSQPMVDLVEEPKIGMFSVLDSACQAPKPDVEAFHQELFKKHPKAKKKDGSPLLERGKPKKKGRKASKAKYYGGTFYHYADKVTYDFEHFIGKNMEKVSADTATVFGKSTNELVKGVFGKKKGRKKKKFTSVTGIFSKALKRLMTNLDKTKPYFIRCVNPNKIKSSKVFVRKVLEDQLRCGGILEALRVLKLGYPTRVQYQLLYQRYQGKIDNPLVKALPPQKFAAAVLIAFGVNQGDYELGLTKIFFKPAKAAILEEIMNQDEPLTEEQNQRVLDWLAQSRIKQLMGSLKVFSFYSAQIRDCRAIDRWNKVGSTMGAVSLSLVRFMKAAKTQLIARKNKEAATAIQSYYRAHVDREALKKKLKKRKTACRKIFKAYRSYAVREQFVVWLTDAVEKTRIEEERKRKEEEARRMAEEERIRKEEAERKKAEEAMKAAAKQEERQKLEAQEAERKRLADEEALKQKQKHAREDVENSVRRQIKDTVSANVESAENEEAALATMKNTVTNLGNQEVKNHECISEADDVIASLVKEFTSIVTTAYAEHQAELARIEKEKEETARKLKEKTDMNRLNFEKTAAKQRQRTALMSKERATALMTEKRIAKLRKMEEAEDNVEERAENELYVKEEKGNAAINEFLDHDHESEDEVEDGPAEEHKEPLKWNMKSFLRTAGNGTLFRKHKYRRRWDDASRYQPKEVFIKVNFDAETHEPLRITWGTGNRHVEWESVKLISWGLHTPTYTAMAKNMQIKDKSCFSVVSTHTILDVQNDDHRVVEMWVKGLRHLLGQTDEEANKLSDELRKHPPTTKKSKKGKGKTKKKAVEEKKPENEEGVEAVRQDRTESLILLQKDLFILTTTTVFRNLEEQYLDVPADIKAEFNPNDMYETALKEDVSWRAWQHWLTDKILDRMREKGYLGKGNAPAAQPGEGTAATAGEGEGAPGKKEDCIIS